MLIIPCVYVCFNLQVIIGTHTVMADGGLVYSSFVSLNHPLIFFIILMHRLKALNGSHQLALAAKHHSVPVR